MLLLKRTAHSGLVTEVFDDSDKVYADVVLLHGCPQSCMPNPVEGLLEVREDMVEVLVVLEIFLIEDSYFEDPWLFFSNDLLHLRLQSVQYDLQHDFAWVGYGADFLVVLALLQVSFLGKCDDLSQLRVLVASENVRFISNEVHIFIAPYKIHAKL